MQKPIYVHYGSTFFEPSRNFPISNHRNWSKPFGGLWASRQDATFGWKDWCEREEFRECDENNSFKFQLCDNSKVAIIHCIKADDMYFGLYGWDCDSIVILNPSVVVPI